MWNQIKTAFLLASLSALFLFLGNLLGGYKGLWIALIISLGINFVSYFFSDSIVLNMYGAQPLSKTEHKDIYEMVHELATTMGLPMPKLWLVQERMANAFATGRNPAHASVAVTSGILALLNKKELRGVLAHELSHVKNRDTLTSTVAATLATAIGFIANMVRFGAYTDDRRSRGNILFMMVVSILMPIAASLLQMAISRSCEYGADRTGAYACKDPLALASALEKLHTHISVAPMASTDIKKVCTAPLFIVHPFTAGDWTALFSTHPPVERRIAELRAIYKELF